MSGFSQGLRSTEGSSRIITAVQEGSHPLAVTRQQMPCAHCSSSRGAGTQSEPAEFLFRRVRKTDGRLLCG